MELTPAGLRTLAAHLGLSLASAVPPHRMTQSDAAQMACKVFSGRFGNYERMAPVFETADKAAHTAVSAGTVGWPGDVIRLGEDLRAGRFVEDVPWLLVATPTLADPTRAPAGVRKPRSQP